MSEAKQNKAVIKGSLKERPFPRLLQQLYRKRVTGYFVVTDQTKDESEVYLRDGMPVHVGRPVDTDRLDNLLIEFGVVSPEIVAQASAQVSEGKRMGDVLEQMGYLDKHKLTYVLKTQVVRKLTRLFFVTEGTYAIYLGEHPYGLGDDLPLMCVDPRSVLFPGIKSAYDLPRVTQELSRLIGQEFRMAEVSPSFLAAMGIPPEDQTVEHLRKGKYTLDALDGLTSKVFEVRGVVLALYYADLLERNPVGRSAQPLAILPASSSDSSIATFLSADSGPMRAAAQIESGTPRHSSGMAIVQTEMSGTPSSPVLNHAPPRSADVGLHSEWKRPPSNPSIIPPPPPSLGVDPLVERRRPPSNPVISIPPIAPAAPVRKPTPVPPAVPAHQVEKRAPVAPPMAVPVVMFPADTVPNALPDLTGPSPPPRGQRPSPPRGVPTARPSSSYPAVSSPITLPVIRTPAVNTPSVRVTTPSPTKPTAAVGAKVYADMRQLISDLDAKIDTLSHFELLGVSESASAGEVGTAFVRAARQFHPDRLAGAGLQELSAQAERILARMSEAAMILGDANRRSEYVAMRKNGGSQVQASVPTLLEAENSFLKGEVFLKKGDYVRAVESFAAALQGNPAEPQYRAYLAWAKYEDPRIRKESLVRDTLHTLEQVVAERPKFARGFYWIGLLWKFLNESEKASRAFRAAVELDSGFIEAGRELRLIEMRKGKVSRPSVKSEPPKGGFMSRFFKK